MACSGCLGVRRNLVTAARRLDIHGVADAVRQAARINLEKARGTYGNTTTPVVKGTPYRRPPDRTT